MMNSDVVLKLSGVSKSFGVVQALKDMNLTVKRGRVHTLLGENGAGKSTLMKILAGVHQADSGDIWLNGRPFMPNNPQDAADRGLSIVFQELSLANNLTVAQNIFANNESSHFGWIHDGQLLKQAQQLIRELGLPINAQDKVSDLSIAKRQLVEIAKGLSKPFDVIILDEPTSSLSDGEADLLFQIIHRLKEQNKAIIYISHRMEEIMRLSDEITVMRDGQYVNTVEKHQTTIGALITMMVGREMNQIYPSALSGTELSQAPLLEVKNLHVAHKVVDVSFDVRQGEILGFFGLIGAGRSDVMRALFGMEKYQGEIFLNGEVVNINSPSTAISHGIGFVTENRKEEGLVLAQSVRQNITMAALPRFVNKLSCLNFPLEKQAVSEQINKLGIRLASMEKAANTLSGGNQQKVVFAKWLETRPKLLILDEPTRGVDVGAKFEIYRIIRELAKLGTAILFVSSELPEVLGLSDRIAIMADKRIKTIVNVSPDLSPEYIMTFATGRAV